MKPSGPGFWIFYGPSFRSSIGGGLKFGGTATLYASNTLYLRLGLPRHPHVHLPFLMYGGWSNQSAVQGTNARALETISGTSQILSEYDVVGPRANHSFGIAQFLSKPLKSQSVPALFWSIGFAADNRGTTLLVDSWSPRAFLALINGSTGTVKQVIFSAIIGQPGRLSGTAGPIEQTCLANVAGAAFTAAADDYLCLEVGTETAGLTVSNNSLWCDGGTGFVADTLLTADAQSFLSFTGPPILFQPPFPSGGIVFGGSIVLRNVLVPFGGIVFGSSARVSPKMQGGITFGGAADNPADPRGDAVACWPLLEATGDRVDCSTAHPLHPVGNPPPSNTDGKIGKALRLANNPGGEVLVGVDPGSLVRKRDLTVEGTFGVAGDSYHSSVFDAPDHFTGVVNGSDLAVVRGNTSGATVWRSTVVTGTGVGWCGITMGEAGGVRYLWAVASESVSPTVRIYRVNPSDGTATLFFSVNEGISTRTRHIAYANGFLCLSTGSAVRVINATTATSVTVSLPGLTVESGMTSDGTAFYVSTRSGLTGTLTKVNTAGAVVWNGSTAQPARITNVCIDATQRLLAVSAGAGRIYEFDSVTGTLLNTTLFTDIQDLQPLATGEFWAQVVTNYEVLSSAFAVLTTSFPVSATTSHISANLGVVATFQCVTRDDALAQLSPNITSNTGYTVAGWVNLRSYTSAGQPSTLFFAGSVDGSWLEIDVESQGRNINVSVHWPNGISFTAQAGTATPGTIALATWYYVSVTWDFSSRILRISINDTLYTGSVTTTTPPSPFSGVVALGSKIVSGQAVAATDGDFDEWAIWQRALTLSNIAYLWNGGAGRACLCSSKPGGGVVFGGSGLIVPPLHPFGGVVFGGSVRFISYAANLCDAAAYFPFEVPFAENTIFSDSFTGTNGTPLASHAPDVGAFTWVDAGSHYQIQSNQLAQVSVGGSNYATINLGVSDGTFLATFPVSTGQILFRFTNTSNYWFLEAAASGPQINLRKNVGGTITTVHTFFGGFSYPVQVEVILSGPSITVNLPAASFTTSDSFNQSATIIGVNNASTSSRYDNFSFTISQPSGDPDASGNGHPLSVHGTVAQVSGKVSQAVRFFGVNDYLSSPHAADLRINGDFGAACWVYFDSLTPAVFLHKSGYQLSLNAGGFVQADAFGSTSNSTAIAPTPIATGQWYLVVLNYAAASRTVSISVNNSSSVTGAPLSLAPVADTGQFILGAFVGRMDEVGVWQRSLSSGDIADLWNDGQGRSFSDTCFVRFGGIVFGGANRSASAQPTGGVIFGASAILKSVQPSGGIVFGGALEVASPQMSGGIVFGGVAIARPQPVGGGIVFGGSPTVRAQPVGGGIVFGGSLPLRFAEQTVYLLRAEDECDPALRDDESCEPVERQDETATQPSRDESECELAERPPEEPPDQNLRDDWRTS